jgi:hypothetical protein
MPPPPSVLDYRVYQSSGVHIYGFILQSIIITTIPTFNAKYKNTYGGKQKHKTHTAAKEQRRMM